MFILNAEMAAQVFNRIGQLGLGVALVGGVINSALYNGKCAAAPRRILVTDTQ